MTCAPDMPTFSVLSSRARLPRRRRLRRARRRARRTRARGRSRSSLDVQMAHAIAPGANILLVTTPTAETLGVQGFPQMMAAEKYVVDHHLADVISQSFGSAEDAFGSSQSMQNLRDAFKAAAASNVTVLGLVGRRRHRQRPQDAGRPGRLDDPRADGLLARLGPVGDRRRRHFPVHRSEHTSSRVATTPTRRRPARRRRAGGDRVGRGRARHRHRRRLQPRLQPGRRSRTRSPRAARRSRGAARRARTSGCRQARHGRAGLHLATAGRQQRPDLRLGPVQHGLVRHRRHLAPRPNGPASSASPPDSWRRPRPDQSGALQGRRGPGRYAADFFDITVGNNTATPTSRATPAHRLGSRHRPRHAERGEAAARPRGGVVSSGLRAPLEAGPGRESRGAGRFAPRRALVGEGDSRSRDP